MSIIKKNTLESLLQPIAEQWGLTGIFLLFACYIAWEYLKNKDIFAKKPPNEMDSKIDTIIDNINNLTSRIESLEDNIASQNLTIEDEADRMETAVQTSNLLYSAIKNNMKDICADHLFVGILHNGTHSIHYLPFMKYDIIVEYFDIISNPNDYDLYSKYKGTDIMIHNNLPHALIQNNTLYFGGSTMEILQKIDALLYNKVVQKGIKHLYLKIITGEQNIPIGFFGAYSFDEEIDKCSFNNCGDLLQDILNNK